MKKEKITGLLLILTAASFWISWLLMPDPGTTDTVHILKIVKAARNNVLGSVFTQIICSILSMVTIILLTQLGRPKKITITGMILLGIGAMGLCADAFFHLLAYFMTDVSVNVQRDVVTVMEFMQTKGVILLIPVLLPFFIGSLVTAIGLNKQGLISRRPQLILISFFAIVLLMAVASKTEVIGDQPPTLILLGIFAAGLAWKGFELMRPSRGKIFFATV